MAIMDESIWQPTDRPFRISGPRGWFRSEPSCSRVHTSAGAFIERHHWGGKKKGFPKFTPGWKAACEFIRFEDHEAIQVKDVVAAALKAPVAKLPSHVLASASSSAAAQPDDSAEIFGGVTRIDKIVEDTFTGKFFLLPAVLGPNDMDPVPELPLGHDVEIPK